MSHGGHEKILETEPTRYQLTSGTPGVDDRKITAINVYDIGRQLQNIAGELAGDKPSDMKVFIDQGSSVTRVFDRHDSPVVAFAFAEVAA